MKKIDSHSQTKGRFLGLEAFHWRWIFILFLALFVVILERNQFQKIEVRIRNSLKEKRSLEAELLPLKLEDRFLYRLERVEGLAKEKLNMQETKPDHILR